MAANIRKVPGTPQPFADWIAAEELWTAADVGAVTKNAEKVESLITVQLADHGSLRTKHKSSVVRVWWLCRTAMSKEENLATGKTSAQVDGPLEPEISEPCHEAWVTKCGFRILSNKILIETMLNSIWSELTSKPRRHTVRLAENLRTQACISKEE